MIETWFETPIFFKDLDTSTIDKEVNNSLEKANIQSAFPIWADTVQTSFKSNTEENNALDYCPTLQSKILESCLEYSKQLNLQYKEIIIRESWLNITEKSQYQHFHIHTESSISGVYYHQTINDGSDGVLVFNHPSTAFKTCKLFKYLNHTVQYEAIKGRLILFPSFLQHAVTANLTDNPRISLSFNIDFFGESKIDA